MVYQMAINGTWDVRKAGEKGWESKRMKTTVSVDSYWLHSKIKPLVCTREKQRFKSIFVEETIDTSLVGGLEHFFHILGIIIPTDFHIFHRVRSTTNHFSMVSN
jgi:hypothetical protein